MIRTVMFDIDGTMYDYEACNQVAMGEVEDYCRISFGLEKDDFRRTVKEADRIMAGRIGYSCAAIHSRLIRYQCMLELLQQSIFPHAFTLQRIYWEHMLKEMRPYEGLVDWMNALKAGGIGIGVGSNMTAEIQYQKLERLGLTGAVDWIVTSQEAGAEKPEKRFFRLCMEKSGAEPEECLFVGDSLKKDVEGAIASGMKALLFEPGAKEEVGKIRDYKTIRSFTECLEQGFLELI